MRAEIPQFEVYTPIPIPREDLVLGGLFSVLQTPGLVVDRVIIRPVEGRTCVGVAVMIDEGEKKGIKKFGRWIYKDELDFIGKFLDGEKAKDPNSKLARVIDIWTAASQALKEAEGRQI